MYYKAQHLSATVLLITTVILATGKHLQSDERRKDERKMFARIFGHALEYSEFARPTYDDGDSFSKQENRFDRYSIQTDENSKFARARMIPYDFSQEPKEPYVYEVTSETSVGTTSTQMTRTLIPAKTSLTPRPTAISTDAPQTSTAASTPPATTISFSTPLQNETQTSLFTTVTPLPSTLLSLFSTILHFNSTTVSLEKSTSISPTSLLPNISSTMTSTPSRPTTISQAGTSLPSTRPSLLSTILHFNSTTASLEKSTSISPTSLLPNISSTMTSTPSTTVSQAGTPLPTTGITSFSTVPDLTNTTVLPEISVSRSSTTEMSTTRPTPPAIMTPTHERKPSTLDPTTANTTFESYTTNSKL